VSPGVKVQYWVSPDGSWVELTTWDREATDWWRWQHALIGYEVMRRAG